MGDPIRIPVNSVYFVAMKASFFLAAFYFVALPAFGQLYPTSDLEKDLKFLNDALIYGHPVNYEPDRRIDLGVLLDKLNTVSADSVDAIAYRIWIDRALKIIGCTHTQIVSNPLNSPPDSLIFFPMALIHRNDSLYVVSATDPFPIGSAVTSINGVETEDLTRDLFVYRTGDGGTEAYGERYFNLFSSPLITGYFGFPDIYEVSTPSGNFEISAAEKYVLPPEPKLSTDTLIRGLKSVLLQKNSVPILQISGFTNKDRSFYRKAIKRINEDNRINLIIDLRKCGGGTRKAAIALTQHLVDTTFGYSMIQPNLETKTYLDKSGRRAYLFSRIKYNWGEFYRSKKSDSGRVFNYTYNPSELNYSGKIFIITDGFTASSSTMLTTWLNLYTETVFTGTQAGGGYNGHNAGAYPTVELPGSGIRIKWPAYRFVTDPNSDLRGGLVPEFVLEGTVEDVIKGKDGVLEMVLEMIE